MIDYQNELNPEQLAVVEGGDGPCLVLAGAGSGKTRTIVYRLAHLLEKGVDPKNICLVTFTNKAAAQMSVRVEQLLGYRPEGLVAGTFHHFANFLLRRFGKRINIEPNFTIIDEDDKKSLIKSSIAEAGIDPKERRFPMPAVLKEIFSYAKNSRQSLEDVLAAKHPKFLEMLDDISAVRRIFEQKKRTGQMIDFDDLLSATLNLLETQTDVREGLAKNFQYILVDEYQDTNPIQAAILYHLASHHKNILVVGDDAQSIYSFRAADIKNIMEFGRVYPEAKIFKLETNYRSTPNILNLANDIISRNRNKYKKVLRAVRKEAEKPQALMARDRDEEASFIADKILELRDQGTPLRDIAVLFRASHHSEILEMELSRRDIPYDYRGGVKFFERSHIKDIISFLRVYHNPADEAAWMRILSFSQGIGAVTARNIFNMVCGAKTPTDVASYCLALPSKANAGWGEFLGLLRRMMAAEQKPSELISQILESYYRDYLESQFTNFEERILDLEEMAKFAGRYESLEQFLSEITLYEDVGVGREKGAASEREKIVLSTIHQAKGLEWHTVFIINLTDGDFPHRRAILEDGGLEEERRLFYVACTRAKENLFLSYAFSASGGGYSGGGFSGGGGMFFNEPSIFLREIKSDLVKKIDADDADDDLPVIDIGAEEGGGRLSGGLGTGKKLPPKSYLRNVDLDF
jgi:DNA helicase-2/ATP-dependent DNA helicase PcrA